MVVFWYLIVYFLLNFGLHRVSPRSMRLTLWEPTYYIFVLRFQPKNSSFRLPYQRLSSSADCARELFKGSNGSTSL